MEDIEFAPLVEKSSMDAVDIEKQENGGDSDDGLQKGGGAGGDSLSKHQHKKRWSLRSALSSCGLYSFCSVSMILVNKSLASSYNHHFKGSDLNVLLVVFQAIAAVICVESCRHLKLIESYPTLSWKTAKAWAPVNIFFCLMLFTGMASLQTNSVPMVTVFKNGE